MNVQMVGRVQLAQDNRKLIVVYVPVLPPLHIGEGSVVIQRPVHERDCW